MHSNHLGSRTGGHEHQIQLNPNAGKVSALGNSLELDDALAQVVNLVNQHGGGQGLQALRVVLDYLETLEKEQPQAHKNIVLLEPYTLTVA